MFDAGRSELLPNRQGGLLQPGVEQSERYRGSADLLVGRLRYFGLGVPYIHESSSGRCVDGFTEAHFTTPQDTF